MATKEELLERAKELDVEGRSAMNKEELEKAVSDAESSSQRPGTGKDSEASDPEVVGDQLSPEGQEALDAMGEDSEAAAEADLGLDASGPLILEHPDSRIMTGAVSEEHAKEQEEALKDKPDDYVGLVSEGGFEEDGTPKGVVYGTDRAVTDEDGNRRPIRQEDVIDFPPPLAEREKAAGTEPNQDQGEGFGQKAPGGPFSNAAVAGGGSLIGDRSYGQKAVMYTDGLSGHADSNLERAYVVPERLQSNDPASREAGDESESEARQEATSDEAKHEAEEVKSGARTEDSEE
jgi:hypothetical protein